jgi:hypothetical protein
MDFPEDAHARAPGGSLCPLRAFLVFVFPKLKILELP